jgi:hypothetical protein
MLVNALRILSLGVEELVPISLVTFLHFNRVLFPIEETTNNFQVTKELAVVEEVIVVLAGKPSQSR